MKVRKLEARDIFSMVRLLNKAGIKRLKEKVTPERMEFVKKLAPGKNDEKKEEERAGENAEEKQREAGINIIMEFVPDLLDLVLDAEDELYKFLSRITETDEATISKLPPDEFMQMVVDIVKAPEFMGFFTAAKKLMNTD